MNTRVQIYLLFTMSLILLLLGLGGSLANRLGLLQVDGNTTFVLMTFSLMGLVQLNVIARLADRFDKVERSLDVPTHDPPGRGDSRA